MEQLSVIWPYIGVALFVWTGFDIIKGHTWLHRKVLRDEEPVLYWALIVLWLAVAVLMFL